MLKSNLKTNLVPSLERGLRLLELISESTRGLSFSELARKSSLPKSSVHGLVLTLEQHGYVRRCSGTTRFTIAGKVCDLADRASGQVETRQIVSPYLHRLMQTTNLTAHLAVMERDQAVLIGKVEPPATMKIATWVGRRMDLHTTGLGKALIANLDEQEIDRLIAEYGLPRRNENTITSSEALKTQLAEIRKRKYAIDDEEDEIGFRCISAPIFDHAGNLLAAISLCGTITQIPVSSLSQLAQRLTRTALQISLHLEDDTA